MALRLPNPPQAYTREWMNQYTRSLETENALLWASIQTAALGVEPTYTTAERLALPNLRGQMAYDSDLKKMCFNTGTGWEIITSAP